MMTMGNYLDENGDFYLTKNTGNLLRLKQVLQPGMADTGIQ